MSLSINRLALDDCADEAIKIFANMTRRPLLISNNSLKNFEIELGVAKLRQNLLYSAGNLDMSEDSNN